MHPPSHDDSGTCELCQRRVPRGLITLHHLVPKQKGGKADVRVPLCKPCHKQIHATFANNDLAKSYTTLEALQKAPQLAGFLQWIRKQKPDRNFKTVTSNGHPHVGRQRRRGGRKY
jgi:hypothetical protein